MVYLPRFWGGLPFPPSYLVEASKAFRLKDEMNVSDPNTTRRKYDSVPTPPKCPPSEETSIGGKSGTPNWLESSVIVDHCDMMYDRSWSSYSSWSVIRSNDRYRHR